MNENKFTFFFSVTCNLVANRCQLLCKKKKIIIINTNST